MHHLDRLVGKLVGLYDAFPITRGKYVSINPGGLHTMPAEHPHDKATLSLFRLILDMALAAFNSRVFVSHIA